MKSIRYAAISTLAVGVACVLSGCGGANSNTYAYLKGVNVVPNGGTATITATGATLSSLAFLSAPVTTAPTYNNATAGMETANFTLSGEPAATYPTYSTSVNSGEFYTAIVLGRADVAASDSRYPKLEIAGDDQTSPASADCRYRVVQAAPDAPGSVEVTVTYGSTTYPSSPLPYGTISTYSELPAGNASVTATVNGSTVLVPATTISTVAGARYTIYVTEATVSPVPTYTIQVAEDSID